MGIAGRAICHESNSNYLGIFRFEIAGFVELQVLLLATDVGFRLFFAAFPEMHDLGISTPNVLRRRGSVASPRLLPSTAPFSAA